MSVQATCKTSFNDEEILVEALQELLGKNHVSVHNNGTEVKGFKSSKKPTITVTVSSYRSAGFYKNSEGNFELVYDSMDRSKLKDIIPYTEKGKKVDRLAQAYTRMKVLKEIKKKNGKVVSTTKGADGSLKIRVRVANY